MLKINSAIDDLLTKYCIELYCFVKDERKVNGLNINILITSLIASLTALAQNMPSTASPIAIGFHIFMHINQEHLLMQMYIK